MKTILRNIRQTILEKYQEKILEQEFRAKKF